MTNSPQPVASDHSPDWHYEKISEFTYLKGLIGEPSPHMKIVEFLTRGLPLAERMWRGGTYLNAYSVGTAEAFWEAWPLSHAREHPDEMVQWIHDNWAGFHTRTERRCVRTPAKFARCQMGLLDWTTHSFRRLLSEPEFYKNNRSAYDFWWGSASQIPFFGRYILIRFIEYANRILPLPLDLYDIRAIGGWSPLRALTLFYPHESDVLLGHDSRAQDLIANEVYWRLRSMPGTATMSYYTYAAMLCEYREAYEDYHQYPGRTHDQELEYAESPKFDHWPKRPDDLWFARQSLFPHEALGEIGGWTGIRHDLSRWLRERGENWSDTRYIYDGPGQYRPRLPWRAERDIAGSVVPASQLPELAV